MRALVVVCLLSAVALGSAQFQPFNARDARSAGAAGTRGQLTGNLVGGVDTLGPRGAAGVTISLGGNIGGGLGGNAAGYPSFSTANYQPTFGYRHYPQGYGYGYAFPQGYGHNYEYYPQNNGHGYEYYPQGYGSYGYSGPYGSYGYNGYNNGYGDHGFRGYHHGSNPINRHL
ncbi:keratin-associated protein 19-2-like [Rhipicephalus sanguineus]|uniref:keratin-associated protein 19-2-like n=1 Tax=Rhipicephalus sanguineus TaxID=34632 RepID=UPI00189378F0|nr:keratin-associated protein 19-2-like [Rhipicephalus sanguineus]